MKDEAMANGSIGKLERTIRQAVDLIERGQPRAGVELLRSLVECPAPLIYDAVEGEFVDGGDQPPEAA